MKNIFAILTILYIVPSIGMESEQKNTRKSCSPGPKRDQVSKHARHRSLSERLSEKMLGMLHLRTEEIKMSSSDVVAALVSDRTSSESRTKTQSIESPKKNKKTEQLAKSDSQNSSPRKSVRLNLGTTDEAKSELAVAMVSDQSSPASHYSAREKESPKKSKISAKIAKSDPWNSSPRKLENNKNSYAKALLLAYAALKKIKTIDDAHGIMECQQYINNVRFFYIQFMQVELSYIYPQWIERAADDEIKPLQEELDTKIAALKETQNK